MPSAAVRIAPALRAVRNILLDIDVVTDSVYGQSVAAFGEVSVGRRQSASRALVASVLTQVSNTRSPTLGQFQIEFTIIVEMFYRVSQDTEMAELMLADAYPAVIQAFYENRRLVDPLTGLPTVSSSVVSGPASNPWYESLAGPEYRLQVVFLNCSLRNTFTSEQPVS